MRQSKSSIPLLPLRSSSPPAVTPVTATAATPPPRAHRRLSSASASSPTSRQTRLPSPAPSYGSNSAWDDVLPIASSSSSTRRGLDRTTAWRRSASFVVVVLFVISIFGMSLTSPSSLAPSSSSGQGSWTNDPVAPLANATDGEAGLKKPDYAKYRTLETLSASQLSLGKKGHRLILVGDIHGSILPLEALLSKLSYHPSHDTLVHVGDLVAKGPKPLEVLALMRQYGVRGVRGNHDQPVIDWRSWMNDVFKNRERSDADDDEGRLDDLMDDWTEERARKVGFPKSWKWAGEHWKIAKSMPLADYEYLVSLPLKLHRAWLLLPPSSVSGADDIYWSRAVPSLHAVIAHAGLVASPPSGSSKSASSTAAPKWKSPSLSRTKAELALMSSLKPNNDAWTLINMRSIMPDGTITKDGRPPSRSLTTTRTLELTLGRAAGNKGTPWTESWNAEMASCTGPGSSSASAATSEDAPEERDNGEGDATTSTADKRKKKKGKGKHRPIKPSPCSPISVIYVRSLSPPSLRRTD